LRQFVGKTSVELTEKAELKTTDIVTSTGSKWAVDPLPWTNTFNSSSLQRGCVGCDDPHVSVRTSHPATLLTGILAVSRVTSTNAGTTIVLVLAALVTAFFAIMFYLFTRKEKNDFMKPADAGYSPMMPQGRSPMLQGRSPSVPPAIYPGSGSMTPSVNLLERTGPSQSSIPQSFAVVSARTDSLSNDLMVPSSEGMAFLLVGDIENWQQEGVLELRKVDKAGTRVMRCFISETRGGSGILLEGLLNHSLAYISTMNAVAPRGYPPPAANRFVSICGFTEKESSPDSPFAIVQADENQSYFSIQQCTPDGQPGQPMSRVHCPARTVMNILSADNQLQASVRDAGEPSSLLIQVGQGVDVAFMVCAIIAVYKLS